jgi:hypothetical protein
MSACSWRASDDTRRPRREPVATGSAQDCRINRRVFIDNRLDLAADQPLTAQFREHFVKRASAEAMQLGDGALKPKVG